MKTAWMDDELEKVNAFASLIEIRDYMKLSWNIETHDQPKLSEEDQLLFWKGFMHGYIALAKEEAINYDD